MKTKFLLLFITISIITNFIQAQSWKLTGNSGTNAATDFVGTTDNKPLIFRTNNTERMRILKNGRIGIGSTNPLSQLQIIGTDVVSLSSNGYLMLGNANSFNMVFDYNNIQSRFGAFGAGSSTLNLNFFGGAVWIGNHNNASIPAIFTATNGTVAIGSSNLVSGYALTVNTTTALSGISVTDPSNNYSIYCIKSGSGKNAYFENSSSGTSDPTIYGLNRGYGEGVYGAGVNAAGVFGYSSSSIGVYGISGSYYGVYAKGGGGAYSAYINGDIYATGSYVGSDQKLKQNIRDFGSAMGIISQLHPKLYNYRQDGDYKLMNFPQGEHYGLIAQEVEKVLPGLVKETKFETKLADPTEDARSSKTIDFKAVNYTELIPVIIKGMQEQQQTIENLKDENAQLKQQMNELKQIVLANNASASTLSLNNSKAAYLLQNNPNPFNQTTTIRCNIPSLVKQAQLVIYSADGKVVRSFSLNNVGMNEITVASTSLTPGQYKYSLIIDGKQVDAKTMILTR